MGENLRGMSPKSQGTVNRIAEFLLKKFRSVPVFFFLLAAAWAQDAAQPNLPEVELRIGGRAVEAEVADEGMLFVMPAPGPAGFWMRNTKVPLTIAYLDRAGTILELHDLQPHDERVVRSAFPNIAYALEMPQGWFTKNNIWPGERVEGLPKAAGK